RDATYSGTVFCDGDRDGVQGDTEPGIEGVTVTLHCTVDGGGPLPDRTTVTDAAGHYAFDVTIPGGVEITCGSSGGAGAVPGKTPTTSLGPDMESMSRCPGQRSSDFGFAPAIGTGDFETFTQGGWGAICHGGNPGCLRDAHFDEVFPDGLVLGDPDGP